MKVKLKAQIYPMPAVYHHNPGELFCADLAVKSGGVWRTSHLSKHATRRDAERALACAVAAALVKAAKEGEAE